MQKLSAIDVYLPPVPSVERILSGLYGTLLHQTLCD